MMNHLKDISQMSVLKYLENSFDNQTQKGKIELVLFPFIVFVILIYSNSFSKESIDVKHSNKTEIKSNIMMKEKITKILNDFEHFIKENEIKLNKISNFNRSIKIEMTASLERQFLFLKFVEDYNSFSKIKYLEQKNNLLIIEIEFNDLYIKNSFEVKNDFKNLDFSFQNRSSFNLSAIIDNKILINDIWLKKGDSIELYKVEEINSNKVLLNSSNKTIELKLNKNEHN